MINKTFQAIIRLPFMQTKNEFSVFKNKNTRLQIGFLLGFCCLALASMAHEIRPAYLEINQTSDSTYSVLWKVPVLYNKTPKLDLDLPFETKEIANKLLVDAYISQLTGVSRATLEGKTIAVKGLEMTLIDVLVRLNLQNDVSYSFLLQPDEPSFIIPTEPSRWQVAKLYTELGIEHILIGIDHLLFVLGLLLLVGNWRLLLQTITAFTVAHSITLGLSAMSVVQVPQRPVEAVIALSIVFLAREYLMVFTGKSSLTAQRPWLVAFSFGLLHGFGFAGALADIGLPQQEIPLALLTFNIGVEIGQLLFIGAVLLLFAGLRRTRFVFPKWSFLLVPYFIGTLAMFWLIERIMAF